MMHPRNGIDGWVKRNDRRNVSMDTVAYRSDGNKVEVRLSNISYDGCQLEAEQSFAIGENIVLELPQMGEVKAQIRWTSFDGRSGCQFMLDESMASERRRRAGLAG